MSVLLNETMKYKLMIAFVIAAHSLCTAVYAQVNSASVVEKENNSSAKEIVEEAVFSLLEQMLPSKQQVKYVLSSSKLFVPKCNLCAGSKAAFQRYERQAGSVPTTNYTVLFSSTDDDARFSELQVMVETAMKHFFSSNTFTSEQKNAIKEKLKAERLRSMTNLHVKKCATCDAVVED